MAHVAPAVSHMVAKNRASHRSNQPSHVMRVLAVAAALPIAAAGRWECPAGSISGSHGIAACCPAACGQCGGRGCEDQAGGRQSCCALDIQMTGRSCNDTAPPCVPLGRVEPGERTQHAVRFVSWNQCGSQAANLGTEHATAYECAAAARDNAACGSAIMFSPKMNAHWGCRCCHGDGTGGIAHKRWQLHRVVNASSDDNAQRVAYVARPPKSASRHLRERRQTAA